MSNLDTWSKRIDNWEQFDKQPNYKNDIKSKIDENIPVYDAIFVLAGGINESGFIYPWVKERLDCAIKIYNNHPNSNTKIISLGGGTYHKTPIHNKSGFVIHESSACAKYLIDNGVPKNVIYREWGSYDTIGNGMFAFTNFILPFGYYKIAIITSEFHILRTKLIFDYLHSIISENREIDYYSTPNNMEQDILSARIRREYNSRQSFRIVTESNTTFTEFCQWFYEKHSAYNNDFASGNKKTIDSKTIKSY